MVSLRYNASSASASPSFASSEIMDSVEYVVSASENNYSVDVITEMEVVFYWIVEGWTEMCDKRVGVVVLRHESVF